MYTLYLVPLHCIVANHKTLNKKKKCDVVLWMCMTNWYTISHSINNYNITCPMTSLSNVGLYSLWRFFFTLKTSTICCHVMEKCVCIHMLTITLMRSELKVLLITKRLKLHDWAPQPHASFPSDTLHTTFVQLSFTFTSSFLAERCLQIVKLCMSNVVAVLCHLALSLLIL